MEKEAQHRGRRVRAARIGVGAAGVGLVVAVLLLLLLSLRRSGERLGRVLERLDASE